MLVRKPNNGIGGLLKWLMLVFTAGLTGAGVRASGTTRRHLSYGRGVQQQSSNELPEMREVCLNTCHKARNGVCEEGRVGKVSVNIPIHMVYCDLGTDCEDCGPWRTTARNVSWEAPKSIGPVRFLKIRDLQVRVRNASVPESIGFAFAYTDPQRDFDVSYHLEGTGILESGITSVVYKILEKSCVKPDGSRHLVVDVGANFGWFAVMAARMGCRVIAYEPVPLFRAFFEYNIHLNNLAHLIEVRTSVVSHESSRVTNKTVKMVVPSRGIWGTAGIDGLNIDPAVQSDHETIYVPSARLEDGINSNVLLLKIDVEGWEWSVVEGAAGLLKDHEVENIIMEYSPGVPERHFRWTEMKAHPVMLAKLIGDYGFRVGQIWDSGKHFTEGWDAPLLPLREVTTANLKYDMEDVTRWKFGELACPTPAELLKFKAWVPCGGVPEGLNPRSLRSEIGHNTNLWASKAKSMAGGLLQLVGIVGVLDPNDPPEKYFQTKGFGMGSRPCEGIGPDFQVKHRCRCSHPECQEEEEVVTKAALEGKIPQNYVLK